MAEESTLYVVATPIGTLSDLSPRAKDILSSVDFVICEDTRHTAGLLAHFSIRVPLESLHAHNEKQKSDFLLEKLKNSPHRTAALVSDAGTPAVSDPGAFLIAQAHSQSVRILTVPGPSSLAAALAVCGFAQPRVLFSGFLERKKVDQRQEFSRWLAVAPCLAVFFESPKRLLETLVHLKDFFSSIEPEVCVCRELSKKFEEHLRGNLPEVIGKIERWERVQGEVVVCVNILAKGENVAGTPDWSDLVFQVQILMRSEGLFVREACKKVAEQHRVSAKELYNLLARGHE